ncbi:beta-2-microglobulin-like [Pimephales promelas]|uniref:beta-2-microglobulin-like n=1 Tax=Pimephales promelas TaxID=90988 RepID=UPI00195555F9|nr:beta-2-microglobulin-like [Pimephales promelas]
MFQMEMKLISVFSVPPDVYLFIRSSSDESKLILTCLATGFYPKEVGMTFRKYHTPLRYDEIESSGVRPNHDGSYQLRKSVEIKKEERDEYDCFVSHSSLKEPITAKLDAESLNPSTANTEDLKYVLLFLQQDKRVLLKHHTAAKLFPCFISLSYFI